MVSGVLLQGMCQLGMVLPFPLRSDDLRPGKPELCCGLDPSDVPPFHGNCETILLSGLTNV